MSISTPYEGTALISDPIHGYITFTSPSGPGEITEKELIDSPWVQRLRMIYQLQSTRLVYPSAEHSRFQHSLGTMHVAYRFAQHLYPSLKRSFKNCPSEGYIHELLRVAGLLHDVGHGPFGHFFDDHFLSDFGLTHEMLGEQIIVNKLGHLIRKVRRSPGTHLLKHEQLNPAHVAYLINKKSPAKESLPKWLAALRPLFGGIYTADNLDYVLRDSYMCGVAVGPVDLDRLIHYTFFTPKGFTLHQSGVPALIMFLNTRLYLYSNVYYHRTTRALDLHLKDIFKKTIQLLFPYHPAQELDAYLNLTDWYLLEEVRRWKHSHDKMKKKLFNEWLKLLHRKVRWKMAFDTHLSIREKEIGVSIISGEELERKIRKSLPEASRNMPFRVDMATQDPRPLNPLAMGDQQIYIYNPSNKKTSEEPLRRYFDYIPSKIVRCRIYTESHKYDALIHRIAEQALRVEQESIPTSV